MLHRLDGSRPIAGRVDAERELALIDVKNRLHIQPAAIARREPVFRGGRCRWIRDSGRATPSLRRKPSDVFSSRLTRCSENVAVLDHDVADVKTHSKFDAVPLRYGRVALGHTCLDLGGGVQRIDNTTELDEEAITHRFYQPAVMRSDRRVDQFGADGPEPAQSAGFVRTD
jgi:hypothetical protein